MKNNTTEALRSYDKNPELLRAYRNGDTEAGEELIRLNSPLVYSIAARFSGRTQDMSDLVECGHIGLVKAMRTFDFSRECAFSTYAVPLIFGEIRRFLRDDGMIKVSREEKKLSSLICAERERRIASGEDAGIAAIAESLGISAADAASALFASAPLRSLDECAFSDDDTTTLASIITDEEEAQKSFNRLALRMAIEKLAPLHKKIVIYRYFRDYSQAKTAELLGLTQVKISREEKKIMEILRCELS